MRIGADPIEMGEEEREIESKQWTLCLKIDLFFMDGFYQYGGLLFPRQKFDLFSISQKQNLVSISISMDGQFGHFLDQNWFSECCWLV